MHPMQCMSLSLVFAASLLSTVFALHSTASISGIQVHGHIRRISVSVLPSGVHVHADTKVRLLNSTIMPASSSASTTAAGSIATDWYDMLLLLSSSVHGPMTKHGVLPESRYNLKEFRNDTTFSDWLKSTVFTDAQRQHNTSSSQQHPSQGQAQTPSFLRRYAPHRHMLAQQGNATPSTSLSLLIPKTAASGTLNMIPAGGFDPVAEVPMSYKCGVFISHKYRFIFIRNRKGASSTVIKALNNNQPLRLTPGAPWYFFPTNERAQGRNPDTLWKDYFVFSTSRNPWSRAASAYDYSLSKWTHHNGSCLDPTFEEFCLDPMVLGKTSATHHCHPPDFKDITHDFYHVEPAYHCLTDRNGQSAIDFVVRYEHMESDLKIAVEIINARKPPGTLPLILPSTILHKNKGTAKAEAVASWENEDATVAEEPQQELGKPDPGPQDSFHQEHLQRKQQRRQQQRREQRHRLRQEAERLLTRSESHYGSVDHGTGIRNSSAQLRNTSIPLMMGAKRQHLGYTEERGSHSISGDHPEEAEDITNSTDQLCDSSCVRAARYRACGRTCVQGIADFFKRDFQFFGFGVPE